MDAQQCIAGAKQRVNGDRTPCTLISLEGLYGDDGIMVETTYAADWSEYFGGRSGDDGVTKAEE